MQAILLFLAATAIVGARSRGDKPLPRRWLLGLSIVLATAFYSLRIV